MLHAETKNGRMALINLDKITLKKTVIGINCPACGGDLKAYHSPQSRMHNLLRSMMLRPRQGSVRKYRCAACRQAYGLAALSGE